MSASLARSLGRRLGRPSDFARLDYARDGQGRRGRIRVTRDRWLIAYADMITLLLACFASLYAATLDQPVAAAKTAGAELTPSRRAIETQIAVGTEESTRRVQAALEGVVRAHGELTALDLTADARGVIISLPEAGSFPIGSAAPTVAAQTILAAIAGVLAGESAAIRVEGHTDDVPIRSAEFASNWELSTARATRVVQFLIEQGALAPGRLSAAGYGEFKPRVPNDTPAARARNRRVDIVVLSAGTMRAEEPAVRGQR